MNFLHILAAKFLTLLTHIPIMRDIVGEFNFAAFAFILIICAGAIAWAVRKWGVITHASEGAGFFQRHIAIRVKNARARVVMAFGTLVGILAISGVFATGMLGIGSELDLRKGPMVIKTYNAAKIAYAEYGQRDGDEGWHTLIQPPLGNGTFDVEHPIAAFIPKGIVRGADIRSGGTVGIASIENALVVIPPSTENKT